MFHVFLKISRWLSLSHGTNIMYHFDFSKTIVFNIPAIYPARREGLGAAKPIFKPPLNPLKGT